MIWRIERDLVMKHKRCNRCQDIVPENKLYNVFRIITNLGECGTDKWKVCKACKEFLVRCGWEEGIRKIKIKKEKNPLEIQTCSFVFLSDILALIENKEAKKAFDEAIRNDGDISFGDAPRTLCHLAYINDKLLKARDNFDEEHTFETPDNYFDKAIYFVNKLPDETYVDLAN